MTVLVAAVADTPALRRVLEDVRAQTRPAGAELLLVVNAAPGALEPASRAALAGRCDRLLFEPAPGKSRALNASLGHARGEIVAFTDDDTEPAEGWLEALAAPLRDPARDPRLVATGGPVRPVFGAEVPMWLRARVVRKATNFLGPRHELGCEPLDYPCDASRTGGVPLGANLAVRREVFERLRFRAELGPNRRTGMRGGEDTVLCREILREGGRIRYVPEALVRHPVAASRQTFDSVVAFTRAYGRETVRVRRALGLPLPEAGSLRRHLWKRRYDAWRARWTREAKRRRRILHAAELGGALEELRRLRRERRREEAAPRRARRAAWRRLHPG